MFHRLLSNMHFEINNNNSLTKDIFFYCAEITSFIFSRSTWVQKPELELEHNWEQQRFQNKKHQQHIRPRQRGS